MAADCRLLTETFGQRGPVLTVWSPVEQFGRTFHPGRQRGAFMRLNVGDDGVRAVL